MRKENIKLISCRWNWAAVSTSKETKLQGTGESTRDLGLLSKQSCCQAFLHTNHCVCILSPFACSMTCTFIHKLAQNNTSETAFKTLTNPKLWCGHVSVNCRLTPMKSKHIICAVSGLVVNQPPSLPAVSFSTFQQCQPSMVYRQRCVIEGCNWRSLQEKSIFS